MLQQKAFNHSSSSPPGRVSTVESATSEGLVGNQSPLRNSPIHGAATAVGASSASSSTVQQQVPLQFRTSSSIAAMPQYTSRDVGDPSQIKKNKQSMADLKLRRLTELNSRLREDLERERIPVSQAAKR